MKKQRRRKQKQKKQKETETETGMNGRKMKRTIEEEYTCSHTLIYLIQFVAWWNARSYIEFARNCRPHTPQQKHTHSLYHETIRHVLS